MDFAEIWDRHKLPLIVTGIGIFIAGVLAVAPAMGPPPATQTPVVVQSSGPLTEALDGLEQRLTGLIAGIDQRLSVLETRVGILDKGVVRGFERTRDLRAKVDALDGTSQSISNLVARVNVLDKAVPRINQRVRAIADGPANDPAMATSVRNLEARVMTLDRAVVRLAERLRNLPEPNVDTDDVSQRIDRMVQALEELSTSLEAGSGQ